MIIYLRSSFLSIFEYNLFKQNRQQQQRVGKYGVSFPLSLCRWGIFCLYLHNTREEGTVLCLICYNYKLSFTLDWVFRVAAQFMHTWRRSSGVLIMKTPGIDDYWHVALLGLVNIRSGQMRHSFQRLGLESRWWWRTCHWPLGFTGEHIHGASLVVGSSLELCTLLLSVSFPLQCKCVLVVACICSLDISPSAVGSGVPALHSMAAFQNYS